MPRMALVHMHTSEPHSCVLPLRAGNTQRLQGPGVMLRLQPCPAWSRQTRSGCAACYRIYNS